MTTAVLGPASEQALTHVQVIPVSVTIKGSSISLTPTGFDAISVRVSGTLGGSGLIITAPSSLETGQIASQTLPRSNIAAYNAAVAVLRQTVTSYDATGTFSNPAVVAADQGSAPKANQRTRAATTTHQERP